MHRIIGMICIAVAGEMTFSTNGTIAGAVAITVACIGLWREKVNSNKLKIAQTTQLTAIGLVDATQLRKELWESLQAELIKLRERDVEQQGMIEQQAKVISSLQYQLNGAREELNEAKRDRTKLREERLELQSRIEHYERQLKLVSERTV